MSQGMPRHISLFPLVALMSLAFAPAASAHHHLNDADWNNDWDQPPQQTWNQAPQEQQPQQQTWNSNQGQGDSQETPSVWNQTPPVNWAPSSNDWKPSDNGRRPTRNPWSNIPALPVSKRPTVAGKTAMIRRNGLAAIPKGAPARVRAIISAANQIIGKPYKWGGGHGRLFDSGYDCSGTVSYALIRAGLLGSPLVSGSLAHWGGRGKGRYVTIYANRGHVYMEVAGLRLDTSSVGDPKGKSGVRWRPPIGKRVGFAVRHVNGL